MCVLCRTVCGRIFLRGVRGDSASVTTDSVNVPYMPEELGHLKEIAEANRDKLIPTVKDI